MPKQSHRVRRQASRLTLVLGFICALSQVGHSALLTNGFAHNDYLHARPLLDALDAGFCGVEADIHLVDGKLLVGHDAEHLKPERTLTALYLDPLQKRIRGNHGKVYPNSTEVLLLLIDIKTEAEATYGALRSVLSQYDDMLTQFDSRGIRTNAVMVILSGNRPIQTVSNELTRFVAIDGRLPDLENTPPLSLIPLISDNWSRLFQWKGQVAMAEPERIRLAEMVRRAHQQGLKIRLWAAPDSAVSWRLQEEAGIDWINTDKISEFAKRR